jgi:hypothetical protein
MCCFAGSAHVDVHATEIFVRMLRPGVQALAYKMNYSADAPVAMILPLPISPLARGEAVRFIDLKGYGTLFSDLSMGFPAPQPRFASKSAAMPTGQVAAAVLAVHEVGDFVGSFVPSQNDFGRLDPRFSIGKDVWSKIPAYRDYGFAVFQLKAPSGSPHPMALEFDTRMPETAYFPTVHIHDGSVHDEDAFDHRLYLQSQRFDALVSSYEGPEHVDGRTKMVRSKDKVSAFSNIALSKGLLDPNLLVHRVLLSGRLPNRDTVFDLALGNMGAGCNRCHTGASDGGTLSSAMVPLGALAWIIARRKQLRGRM